MDRRATRAGGYGGGDTMNALIAKIRSWFAKK